MIALLIWLFISAIVAANLVVIIRKNIGDVYDYRPKIESIIFLTLFFLWPLYLVLIFVYTLKNKL